MHFKTNITGVTADSRQVRPGYLFAALPGVKADGRDYINQAIQNGAKVILAPSGTPVPLCCHPERSEGSKKDPSAKPQDDMYDEIEFLTDDNPRRAYAYACADFYKHQPGHIVAVTGTNGKTSTVNFIQQIWQELDINGASLGTLGIKTAEEYIEGAMTTPDPQVMHETLAGLYEKNITHVALEASSHGLDQCRLEGVKIRAAAFTNLTQDHLDYHGDLEAYFQAKARLFGELLDEGSAAVLNTDMAYFPKIKEVCEQRSLRIMGYGHQKDEYLSYEEPEPTLHGYYVKLTIEGQAYDLHIPLVGRFQVDNALAALLLVHAEGRYPLKDILSAVSKLKPVRGRLEAVPGHPKQAGVFVDYAHTPDALVTALKSLSSHARGRLICVFGCGGDRDKAKRPLMAKAVSENADVAILTDDNPRTEDPASIRADALKGAPDVLGIADRREAIDCAIKIAEEGDIVLIAGKGHEQGQEIMGVKHPFDDVSEVKKAMERLS